MLSWILKIPDLAQNLFCGGVGALFFVLYGAYDVLPDIKAQLTAKKRADVNRDDEFSWVIFVTRAILSIICAAFVSGFLVRPQESYGAIITGMTWPTIVKGLIRGK